LLTRLGLVYLAGLWLLPLTVYAQAADNAQPSEDAAITPAATGPIAPQPENVQPANAQPENSQSENSQIDKRIFGVLPNYRTADGTAPYQPISAKGKFYIAAKDSFDYPVYPLAGGFAALYQLDNQNPSYGQGLRGYAKRFGAAYGDQAIGNLMTEAVFPALLHEDPRYFRIGPAGGSARHRTLYALTRVFVTHNDHGGARFNFSEWLGNGAAVAISNLYYPSDTRNVSDNLEKLGVQVATDAFSQVLKEFWPDWKRKLFKKKS